MNVDGLTIAKVYSNFRTDSPTAPTDSNLSYPSQNGTASTRSADYSVSISLDNLSKETSSSSLSGWKELVILVRQDSEELKSEDAQSLSALSTSLQFNKW